MNIINGLHYHHNELIFWENSILIKEAQNLQINKLYIVIFVVFILKLEVKIASIMKVIFHCRYINNNQMQSRMYQNCQRHDIKFHRKKKCWFEKSISKLVIQKEASYNVILKMHCFNLKVIYSYAFLHKSIQWQL